MSSFKESEPEPELPARASEQRELEDAPRKRERLAQQQTACLWKEGDGRQEESLCSGTAGRKRVRGRREGAREERGREAKQGQAQWNTGRNPISTSLGFFFWWGTLGGGEVWGGHVNCKNWIFQCFDQRGEWSPLVIVAPGIKAHRRFGHILPSRNSFGATTRLKQEGPPTSCSSTQTPTEATESGDLIPAGPEPDYS